MATLTLLISLVTYGDGVIAEGDGLLVEDVCAHAGEARRAHEATLVRVYIHAGAVHQQELSAWADKGHR